MAENPKTIEALCKVLNVSESQLKGLRRKYRMEHGDEADTKLERWLRTTWEEMRDKPRLMRPTLPRIRFGPEPKPLDAEELKRAAEESAYTSNGYQSYREEPESVPRQVQEEYSRNAWHTFDVLKGEELARREVRARAERLRQAELELRQKGKSPDQYVRAVDDAIAAMRAEAKAA